MSVEQSAADRIKENRMKKEKLHQINRKLNKQAGFTLAEMVIVMAMVSAIVGVGASMGEKAKNKGEKYIATPNSQATTAGSDVSYYENKDSRAVYPE